jgi:hypothetical protein
VIIPVRVPIKNYSVGFGKINPPFLKSYLKLDWLKGFPLQTHITKIKTRFL